MPPDRKVWRTDVKASDGRTTPKQYPPLWPLTKWTRQTYWDSNTGLANKLSVSYRLDFWHISDPGSSTMPLLWDLYPLELLVMPAVQITCPAEIWKDWIIVMTRNVSIHHEYPSYIWGTTYISYREKKTPDFEICTTHTVFVLTKNSRVTLLQKPGFLSNFKK